jgi:hypothetical protein
MVDREEEGELTVGSSTVRLWRSGFEDGGDAGVPGGDRVHDEIRRSAVISWAWSASLFVSSGEAEGWLEGAWAVGALDVGLRRRLGAQ